MFLCRIEIILHQIFYIRLCLLHRRTTVFHYVFMYIVYINYHFTDYFASWLDPHFSIVRPISASSLVRLHTKTIKNVYSLVVLKQGRMQEFGGGGLTFLTIKGRGRLYSPWKLYCSFSSFEFQMIYNNLFLYSIFILLYLNCLGNSET